MSIPRVSRSYRAWLSALSLVALAATVGACGGDKPGPKAESAKAPVTTSQPASASPEEEMQLPPPAHEVALPEVVRSMVAAPFTGDLDEMVKRRLIRVGVTYNRTFYFVDKGVQRGAAYEFAKAFEDWLNTEAQDGQREGSTSR